MRTGLAPGHVSTGTGRDTSGSRRGLERRRDLEYVRVLRGPLVAAGAPTALGWWHPNGRVGALALLVLHGVLPGAFEEFNPIRGPFRRRIQCD